MSDQEMPQFPLSLELKTVGITKTFESEEAAQEWLSKEHNFWNQLAAHHQQQSPDTIRNNMAHIDFKDVSLLASNIDTISSSYFPSETFIYLFGALGIFDPTQQSNVVAEALSPRATALQFPNPHGPTNPQSLVAPIGQFMETKIAGSMVRMFGDPQHLRSALSDIELIKSEISDTSAKFKKLLEDCSADWQTQINDFTERAALKAPKEFWKSRSKKHDVISRQRRNQWNISILVIIIFVLALPVILFSKFMEDKFGFSLLGVSGIVERAVVIATILALLVWWSRQLLRDLRSHENLCEDAEERVTMIETYAALSERGLNVPELSTILTVLYRPAAMNMADDGGPALPYEVILKAAADIAKSRPQ